MKEIAHQSLALEQIIKANRNAKTIRKCRPAARRKFPNPYRRIISQIERKAHNKPAQLPILWILGYLSSVIAPFLVVALVYYTYFGEFLLNNRYTLLPAAEAIRQSNLLFEQFAVNGELFARPSVGRKLFTGRTFENDDFKETLSKIDDPRSLILISNPKKIDREWRLYVAHDSIVTFSQYAVNGERELKLECPSDVLNYGNKILKKTSWRPDPIFSMDLCESDGQIRLLELNGFSCSNLYACDLSAIIDTVIDTLNPYGQIVR